MPTNGPNFTKSKNFQKCFKRLLTALVRQQSFLKDLTLLFPVFLVEISKAGFKDVCCKVLQFQKADPWWKTLAETRDVGGVEAF